MAECVSIGCVRPVSSRGLCRVCYQELWLRAAASAPTAARPGRTPERDRPYDLELLLAQLPPLLVREVCQRLGVSSEMLREYRARGLTWRQADRLAVRAGLHPAMVWPTWVPDGLTPLDEVFLESGWRQAWLWNEQHPEPVRSAA